MHNGILSRFRRGVSAMWHGSPDPTGTGYDVAGERGTGKRREAKIELKHEDEILNPSKRLRVLNLTREGIRNAPQVRALVQQLRVLIVGLQGGKLVLSTDASDWNNAAQSFFTDHAAAIDFIDGTGLNECLKLIITALAAEGGDFAAVFDSGILSGGNGTGKLRFFESDNIANLEPTEFERRFGKEWSQSQGLIYNELGRFVGIVLSGKKRGKTVFAKEECFTLVREPDAPLAESDWFYGKRKWRLLQGRGISPQTVAIAALLDMYELITSEVQTGKLNSKVFAQVLDDIETSVSGGDDDLDGGAGEAGGEEDEEDSLPDDDTDTKSAPPVLDVTDFEATAGSKVLNMPPGAKLDLIDLKRPSENSIRFVEFLLGGSAAVHGLTRVYAGMKAEASYTAFRGEQCMAWASIEEAQKELERGILDWLGRKVIAWAAQTGRLADGPEGWQTKLSWQWPTMKEVNEVDAQTAVSAKLKNCVTTYRALLGPHWRTILTQVSEEVKWFTENGLPHPATQTVSGQIAPANNTNNRAARGKDTEE